MINDFPTASTGSLPATINTVGKSPSASHTEIQTLPGRPMVRYVPHARADEAPLCQAIIRLASQHGRY